MAINISGILKSPQGSAIQNAEIIFEQTRTSTEVLAGTKFSVITNQAGNYSSSLGVGTYVFKVRFQDETQYRTVASNVIVTQSMNNYSLNQIIQDQSWLQDVDYDLLQAVIQVRDQAAASASAAQASQSTATTKASEASDSAQAALASKNAAQTSQTNAASSQTAAANSQTAAANSQTTATTKATEASNSAQGALTSKNAAQTSETNALASKNAAQASQATASTKASEAATSQTAAGTKAGEAAASQTQAQQSQSEAGAAASQADNSAQQAQQSQASASTSQATATTKASEASSSAQAALASKNAAQTSETNALSSKNAAQTSQTNAAGSQTAAATSQTTASTKAGEASTSQTNAAASQTTASTKAGEASTSQTNAAASQTTATTKAGEASTSQTNAAASQATATTKATEAANSATLAQKWAANPENSIVSGGLYSALHYAAKAAQSAQTASGQLVWRGGWSAQAGSAPPTPSGATQDFYRITQAGTILSVQYEVGDYIHWDNLNSIWFKMDGTDSVTSVNGRTGAVVVTKTDVGLSAVNNWSASSQTNDASTTTYATTAGVKAAYDLAATKLAATANAVSATKLVTARTINGTNFDGTANITTQNWGTARTLTIGNAAKSVNGDGNVSWSLSEIGAYHPGNKPSLGSDLGLQWQLPNPDGTSRYVRLVTLNLTDNDITFVLAGFGDFGATRRATYNVTVATRGSGISVDVNALDVDLLQGEKPIIYHRRVGESFEVWVKTPRWCLDATFTRMSGPVGVVNIDSSTTIEPTGLTAVTINQIYTTRFKPTAGDVGAVSKTGDTMTGNLTAPAVLVSSAQNTSVNALTRKDYVDSVIAAGDALQVSKSGDSMIGQLILTPSFVDTSNNAQLAHIGKDATKPLYIRNMREHNSSSWLWEKVYNGSLYYSSGTNGSGTNRIRLQVSGSGEIYLGENADKRVYHEGFKPTASELAVVPDTRTVNGKRLNTDITITSEDVGAYNKQGQEDLVQASQLPFPDVWAPLSDNLRMLQGYGDDIAVGDYVVATQISFSRNSSATYIGKDGLLKTAAANEPRFEKEGLLIEEQSTNLWHAQTGTQLSILNAEQESVTLPTGVSGNVYKVVPSSTVYSYVRFSPSQQTGQHTLSCFARKADGSDGMPTLYAGFAGALSIKASGIYLGAGWWRMYALVTNPVGNTGFGFAPTTIDPIPVHICFFQLEALPFATSYIPTNGAAATRAQDLCDIPADKNWPNLTNPISMCATVSRSAGGEMYYISYPIGTAGLRHRLGSFNPIASWGSEFSIPGDTLGTFTCGFSSEGTGGIVRGFIEKQYATKPFKTIPEDAGSPLGKVVRIGRYIHAGRGMFGHIRNFRIWHSALTDEQIKAIK